MAETDPRFDTTSLEQLITAVEGAVYLPADEHYAAECSPFNLAVAPQPAVIVGAACAADVAAAVRFATANGMPIGVQATGHGIVHDFAGGVMVTTSRMKGVEVDPEARRVRIEPGVRWSEVTPLIVEHGLAPVSGAAPTVGAVGYLLGGGLSLLGRKHGYAADHVQHIEVVTADGELRIASPSGNEDLFWALRGGKGNFGIVTAIEFDVFPLPEFYAGALLYPGERAAEVLAAFREWSATLPEEMGTSIAIMRMPPLPAIPEPLRGQFLVSVRISYTGDAETGAALIEPMRALGPSVMDTVGPMPYTSAGMVHMDPPDPIPARDIALSLTELSDDAAAAFLGAVGPESDSILLLAELRLMGGALARPPAQPNAICHRDAAFHLYAVSPLMPGIEAKVLQDLAALQGAMAPFGNDGACFNFLGVSDAENDRVNRAFDTETLSRLLAIKAAHDPENIFRLNHNLRPANEA